MMSVSLYFRLAYLGLLAGVFRIAQASVANVTMFYDGACKIAGQEIPGLLSTDGNCTSIHDSDNFAGVNATYLAQGCQRKFYIVLCLMLPKDKDLTVASYVL